MVEDRTHPFDQQVRKKLATLESKVPADAWANVYQALEAEPNQDAVAAPSPEVQYQGVGYFTKEEYSFILGFLAWLPC